MPQEGNRYTGGVLGIASLFQAANLFRIAFVQDLIFPDPYMQRESCATQSPIASSAADTFAVFIVFVFIAGGGSSSAKTGSNVPKTPIRYVRTLAGTG